MTKAIVIYNSKGGNTKKVAEKIAEGLEAECVSYKKIPDLVDYNLVVVGSWMIWGRLSFAGARYLKKLKRKSIEGKKIALFFTAGAPEDIHYKTANTDNPIQQKQIMFDSMESILNKNKDITILSERFYCRGALRMMGNAVEHVEHPTEDELNQAKAFGESLKKKV